MIPSFDLIAKEFRLVVDIPDSLKLDNPFFSISKLMESLVLFVCGKGVCGVWKIEHDGSCTKLFTFSTNDGSIRSILGFRKNGELVMKTQKTVHERFARFEVYEPCSKRIKNNLWIDGINSSFFMSSYKETLLLLDHSDCCVYHWDFEGITRCGVKKWYVASWGRGLVCGWPVEKSLRFYFFNHCFESVDSSLYHKHLWLSRFMYFKLVLLMRRIHWCRSQLSPSNIYYCFWSLCMMHFLEYMPSNMYTLYMPSNIYIFSFLFSCSTFVDTKVQRCFFISEWLN